MKMRRLYTLLVVWFALLTAPATLTALGVFGSVDTHKSISGGLAACWIIGYLAQFGFFMWIMKLVANQDVLWRTLIWWFSGSLLPWALDWTPQTSLLFPVWYAVAIGIAVWIAVAAHRTESFEERAVRGTGVVLEVFKPMMNVVINNVYIKRKLRLRIERSDGAPAYETTWNGLFMLGEIPSPGDRIPMLVDPANPQHVDDDQNENGDTDRARSAAVEGFRAPPSEPQKIGDDLERLAALHARGDLTDSEFAAAKRKLLR
jgi:putative oligomerization/nucleic acid binding protein